MAAQSLLAKMGMRMATLGTSASLAFAAPLAEGNPSMAAHTDATRIGTYYDRTPGVEKTGMVVMGVEILSVGVTQVSSSVPISLPASTTTTASMIMAQGVAPTSPTNGMVWLTSAGMFTRAGGVTFGPFAASGGGGITGTLVSGRVPFANGVATVTDSAKMVFDATTGFNVNLATTGTNNLMLGTNAGAAGLTSASDDVIIGVGALHSVTVFGPSNSVIIGRNAMGSTPTGGGGFHTAIGQNALADTTGSLNTSVGFNSGTNNLGGSSNVFLGAYSGDDVPLATSNAFAVGGRGSPITDFFIGNGVNAVGAGTSVTLHVSNGAGISNVVGGSFTISPGASTGSAASGSFIVRTAPSGASGTTQNSLVTRFTIPGDGATAWTGIATASAPALSAASEGRIFYDSTLQKFRYSANGAAYADLTGAGGGGISGTLTATRVPYATGASTITDDANFTYDSTSGGSINGLNIAGAKKLTGCYGPGNVSTNVVIGDGASRDNVDGDGLTIIGYNAMQSNVHGAAASVVGSGSLAASTSVTDSAVVGGSAFPANVGDIAGLAVIGSAVFPNYNGNGSVSGVGYNIGQTLTTGTGVILLGYQADVSAGSDSNLLVAGSDAFPISDLYFAQGMISATPSGYTVHGTGGSGADVAGGAVTIAGGRGTGTGVGGALVFQTASASTSSSTPNALVTRLSVTSDGATAWTGIATASAPAVSAASTGRIFYDSTLQAFRASANTGAYVSFTTGTLVSGRVAFSSGTTSVTDSAKMVFSTSTGFNINMASSGANNLMLGTSAGTAVGAGARNVAIGVNALSTLSTSSDTVAIGYQAATTSNGAQSVYIGASAAASFAGTFGDNVVIGFQAGGGASASASSVTLVGSQAGKACTASNTTAIGNGALSLLTSGLNNVAVGSSALGVAVTAANCTAVGMNALAATTGDHNTVVGANSGDIIAAGHSNTIIGSSAGRVTTTGVGNIFLGRGAGDSTALGASNRFVAGGSSQPIADVWFGNGEASAGPTSYIVHGTGGSGTNIAGGSVTIAPGQGTGTGVGGSFVVQTALAGASSSSPNALTTRLTIDSTGLSTFTGRILTSATTTTRAGLNLPHGTAPSSPVDGDLWTTSAGLFVRVNGVTVGPLT